MKKFFCVVFVLLNIQLYSQNLDSLYNEFLRVRGISTEVSRTGIASHDEQTVKCGFGLSAQIRTNYDKFSFKQQQVLSSLLNRPVDKVDTSFISPKGWFRIHFNKSNFPDYVPENIRNGLTAEQLNAYKRIYLDSLAVAADSAYSYEVNFLNYPAPPEDNAEGGCYRYDIYCVPLGTGEYGSTEFEINSPISYMLIDDDFTSTYSKRIYGVRVTVAHELHHAIQIGNYAFRESDRFYHEISSTAMEEFVFDSVNDYYAYLPSFMRNTQRSFTKNNGYNLAIWNIFLKDRFGFDILKRIWELMRDGKSALNSINDAIVESKSSFKEEFALFGQWLFFTGWRAEKDKYFNEASYYPILTPTMKMNFTPPQSNMQINSEPVSTNFLVFTNNLDTLVAVVSNVDLSGASNSLMFNYTLSNKQENEFRKIVDGFYGLLTSNMISALAVSEIFNNVPAGNGQIITAEINYPFPQPFRYSKHSEISLPVEKSQTGYAEVSIYSVDMDLIYSGNLKIFVTDKVTVRWDAIDNSKKKLSSGVYFYFALSGDKIKKGKFVILND